MLKPVFSFLAVALMTLATGCAVQLVQPGASQEEVVSRYGPPSRVVALASGSRLQYSRQPAGQSAVMVDLDAAGKVISARQVMKLNEFLKIEPLRWTREAVEQEFGRPATVDRVASWSGDIMTYRWLDADQSMFFWVYLDGNNVVQRTSQGMEFIGRRFENL